MSLLGWFFLLLVVAVAGAAVARRRQRSLPVARQPSGDPHDLTSLGLTAARPVGPAPAAGDPPDEARGSRGAPARSNEPTGPAAARPRARASAPAVAAALGSPWADPAVSHLLASLAAHVGGGVAVVRHDGEHHVVAARTDGGALAPIEGRPLALDGPMELGPGVLGGLSELVSGFAYAVPVGTSTLLIGGEGEGEGTARYLDLLAALMPGPVAGRPASAEPAPAAPDAAELDAEIDAEPSPVPRAEVIAQEQRAAHEAGRPLAFALVTLADAEERLTSHPVEEVALAESDLRERLRAAPGLRRLEPFGDLLFGVFLDLDPEGTAAWCDRLASGDPPLFIGAVAPAAGDPAGVRAAAVDALRDAYDHRRTHIVEA